MLDATEKAVDFELSRLEAELEAAVQEVVALLYFLCHLLIYIFRLMTRVKIFSSLWSYFDGMPIQH
jgi:hypothetical protein